MTIYVYSWFAGLHPSCSEHHDPRVCAIEYIDIVKYYGPLETNLVKTGKANGTFTFMQSVVFSLHRNTLHL